MHCNCVYTVTCITCITCSQCCKFLRGIATVVRRIVELEYLASSGLRRNTIIAIICIVSSITHFVQFNRNYFVTGMTCITGSCKFIRGIATVVGWNVELTHLASISLRRNMSLSRLCSTSRKLVTRCYSGNLIYQNTYMENVTLITFNVRDFIEPQERSRGNFF